MKNFYCSDKSCPLCALEGESFPRQHEKTIDKKMAADLLKTGKTHVTDLYSAKKNATFAADLVMQMENGRPAFRLFVPETLLQQERKSGGPKEVTLHTPVGGRMACRDFFFA